MWRCWFLSNDSFLYFAIIHFTHIALCTYSALYIHYVVLELVLDLEIIVSLIK